MPGAQYQREESQDSDLKMDIPPPVSPHVFVNEIDFDELEILKVVGRGAFGIVQKACWRGFIVAVKTLENINGEKEFRDEVQQLSSVQHKNIIKLFGTSVKKPKVCLIMEYAECGSLYNLLHPSDPNKEPIPYTFAHVMSWSLQCAEAVAYLHNVKPKPIVHRDLKPPNMLLTNRGVTLKICDFGTACVEHDSMTSNRGSASWMAPEVFEGTRYTIKCDVYSFGIVLWEMLTRKKPFEEIGPPAFRIMWAVHNGTRPPPVQNMPECLEKLMNSCWTKEQDRRPTFSDIVEFFRIVNMHITGGNEPIFAAEEKDIPDFIKNCYVNSAERTSIPYDNRKSIDVNVNQHSPSYGRDKSLSPITDTGDKPRAGSDPCNRRWISSSSSNTSNISNNSLYQGPNKSPFSGPNTPVSFNLGLNQKPLQTSVSPNSMPWTKGPSPHTDQVRTRQPYPHSPFSMPYSQYPPNGSITDYPRFTSNDPMFIPVYLPVPEEKRSTSTSSKRTIDASRPEDSKWHLVPSELMPVNPVESDKESVQMYKHYVETLKKYISLQEDIAFLKRRKEVIQNNIEEEDQEQKQSSRYIEDYIKLQDEKQSWLELHSRAKTHLERGKAEMRKLQIRKISENK